MDKPADVSRGAWERYAWCEDAELCPMSYVVSLSGIFGVHLHRAPWTLRHAVRAALARALDEDNVSTLVSLAALMNAYGDTPNRDTELLARAGLDLARWTPGGDDGE